MCAFWLSVNTRACACVRVRVCVCVLNLLYSEHDVGEDDIYDCVPCEDEGDDIYEDIIKVEVRQPMVSEPHYS